MNNGVSKHREQADAGASSPMTPASVLLPLPISANRIWRRFGKRIVKNPKYVLWQSLAARIIADAKLSPIEGAYNLSIMLPIKTRCDADNYIKGISDMLQRARLISDDKLCRTITVLRGDVAPKHCLVTVTKN